MEKLYELHDETDFDLVVVDTPPTRHALDFLDAPRRLSRFLDHRLFRLLIVPSRGIVKAVNVAAQTFLRTVSKVVGGDVVDDAVAFFQAFEGMEEGFRQRAARVNELLAAPTAPRSCWWRRPGATRSRRPTSSPSGWARPASRCGGWSSTGCTRTSGSGTTAGAGPRRPWAVTAASAAGRPGGPRRWRARRSAASTATSPTSRPSPAASRPTWPGWPRRWRRPRSCGCRSCAATCTTWPGWARWPATCSRGRRTPETGDDGGGLLLVERGGRLVEGGDRRLDGLGDRDDAVEAGGVEQAGEGGPAAGHRHVAARLAGPADAADQRPEARRVHERHRRQVDEQVALVGQLAERIAELPDGVGVELADGPADGVAVGLVNLDVEHCFSSRDPPGDRSGGRSVGKPVKRHWHPPVTGRPVSPLAPHCSPTSAPPSDVSSPELGGALASRTVSDVLIATDADWIFDDVDAALSDENTRVFRVRRGRDVSAAVRKVQPDLIVLDLQIGNMGGIATALNLEQEFEEGTTPVAPILLLLDRPADVPLARRWAVDGWLIKPLDSFRLRRAAKALRAGDTYEEPSGLAG